MNSSCFSQLQEDNISTVSQTNKQTNSCHSQKFLFILNHNFFASVSRHFIDEIHTQPLQFQSLQTCHMEHIIKRQPWLIVWITMAYEKEGGLKGFMCCESIRVTFCDGVSFWNGLGPVPIKAISPSSLITCWCATTLCFWSYNLWHSIHSNLSIVQALLLLKYQTCIETVRLQTADEASVWLIALPSSKCSLKNSRLIHSREKLRTESFSLTSLLSYAPTFRIYQRYSLFSALCL